MNDHDINWIVLIPLALVLGMAALMLETAKLWPGSVIRPDIVWCLAFFAIRRTVPPVALGAAFVCGVARDLTLGPKLGAAALAYLIIAWVYLHLREIVAGGGFAELAILVGALAFCVNLLKVFLDLGGEISSSWSEFFITALGDGFVTLIAYPVMYLILSLYFLDPTRERRWSL